MHREPTLRSWMGMCSLSPGIILAVAQVKRLSRTFIGRRRRMASTKDRFPDYETNNFYTGTFTCCPRDGELPFHLKGHQAGNQASASGGDWRNDEDGTLAGAGQT